LNCPGYFAKVEVVTDRHEISILIPRYAILENIVWSILEAKSRTAGEIDKYVFVIVDSLA
jgi:hypothetical protein